MKCCRSPSSDYWQVKYSRVIQLKKCLTRFQNNGTGWKIIWQCMRCNIPFKHRICHKQAPSSEADPGFLKGDGAHFVDVNVVWRTNRARSANWFFCNIKAQSCILTCFYFTFEGFYFMKMQTIFRCFINDLSFIAQAVYYELNFMYAYTRISRATKRYKLWIKMCEREPVC